MSRLAEFHHRLDGPPDGRKWVFLHGLMGFLNNWRRIIAGLESTERCFSYDQRGHGRSIKPPAGYAPEDYANDLRDLLDELGWEKIILVGHSMGARNGLNFCARWPERVEKFVLEDIGPRSAPNNSQYYRDLLGVIPAPFPDRTTAREFFSGEFLVRARSRDNPKMLAEYFYANMEEKDDGTFSWRFLPEAIFQSVAEGENRDRWDEVRGLKVPTLLVKGELSRELSEATYKEMLTSNPIIQGVIIPGAAHWVHSDKPNEFLAEIRKFAGF